MGFCSPPSTMWKARSFSAGGYRKYCNISSFRVALGYNFSPDKEAHALKQCRWKAPLFRISSVQARGMPPSSVLHRDCSRFKVPCREPPRSCEV